MDFKLLLAWVLCNHLQHILVNTSFLKRFFELDTRVILSCGVKGTRCLGSDELVYKKHFVNVFLIKCIWLKRCFKSRIQ